MPRRAWLRRRSAKMEALYAGPGGRRALVARLLQDRPWCEMRVAGVCTGRSVDVHEKLTRARGGSILDEANLVTGCRPCHTWTTENPEDAEAVGLLVWSWDGAVG